MQRDRNSEYSISDTISIIFVFPTHFALLAFFRLVFMTHRGNTDEF